MEQGDSPKSCYVVLSGLAKCTRQEENGKCFLLEFLGEGQIFGDIEITLGIPRIAGIKTITQTEAIVLDKSLFVELLGKEKDFNLLYIKDLATKTILTSQRSSMNATNTALYNLLEILRESKIRGDLHIEKADFADYLGISVRSLNRLLKNKEIAKLMDFDE